MTGSVHPGPLFCSTIKSNASRLSINRHPESLQRLAAEQSRHGRADVQTIAGHRPWISSTAYCSDSQACHTVWSLDLVTSANAREL